MKETNMGLVMKWLNYSVRFYTFWFQLFLLIQALSKKTNQYLQTYPVLQAADILLYK